MTSVKKHLDIFDSLVIVLVVVDICVVLAAMGV